MESGRRWSAPTSGGTFGRRQRRRPRQGAIAMAKCEVCGNDYDKAFQVVAAGFTHTFDSFECAAHKLAPRCEHCGCIVLGHGVFMFPRPTSTSTTRSARTVMHS